MSPSAEPPAAQVDDADTVDPGARKERVLHTRVPDSLDRHIKRRARSLGMSASTVVRNVLLTTFGLVEDIVNDSADIALAVTGHRPDPARPRTRARDGGTAAADDAPILAWQRATLNRNAICADCNAILHKGEAAAIGIREDAAPGAVICPACLRKIERPAAQLGSRR
jgi:hypothetical protein